MVNDTYTSVMDWISTNIFVEQKFGSGPEMELDQPQETDIETADRGSVTETTETTDILHRRLGRP